MFVWLASIWCTHCFTVCIKCMSVCSVLICIAVVTCVKIWTIKTLLIVGILKTILKTLRVLKQLQTWGSICPSWCVVSFDWKFFTLNEKTKSKFESKRSQEIRRLKKEREIPIPKFERKKTQFKDDILNWANETAKYTGYIHFTHVCISVTVN